MQVAGTFRKAAGKVHEGEPGRHGMSALRLGEGVQVVRRHNMSMAGLAVPR